MLAKLQFLRKKVKTDYMLPAEASWHITVCQTDRWTDRHCRSYPYVSACKHKNHVLKSASHTRIEQIRTCMFSTSMFDP